MNKIVEQLGQKIGQTVETLWPHAVRYIAIEGSVWIVAWWIAVFVCAIGYYLNRKKEWQDDDDDRPTLKLIFAICLTATFIVAILVTGTYLPQVLEPTGY